MKLKKLKIKKISVRSWINGILIILLALAIYLIRPWLHPIIMLFYKIPFAGVFILSVLFTYFFFKRKKYSIGTILLLIALASLIILLFNSILIEKYIVQETKYNKIDVLPDSTDLRMVPKDVARRYLEDSLLKSREKVGDLNIVNMGDKLVWAAPRIPEGIVLYLTQKVNGIMVVDATKVDRKTNLISKTMNIGEGIGITDNIYWGLYKQRYFADIGDVYYIYEDGNVITVAPIITYKFKFPVMVPYYDGVFVVHESGSIIHYPPEKVESKDFFQNNRAYPEKLARLYVDSYKYHLGIINQWFLHEDQIEISDVPGEANRQPFLMPTTEGLKWVIATEPYGESYGVFKIFIVDALTGRIDMLELSEDQTLTGPVKVIDYVKKKFPTIDWSVTKVIEPRPYVINGVLYWMLSITPSDYAGISYTVFVNSWNNEVIPFETEEGVRNFLKGGPVVEEEEKVSLEKKREELVNEIEGKLKELKELLK